MKLFVQSPENGQAKVESCTGPVRIYCKVEHLNTSLWQNARNFCLFRKVEFSNLTLQSFFHNFPCSWICSLHNKGNFQQHWKWVIHWRTSELCEITRIVVFFAAFEMLPRATKSVEEAHDGRNRIWGTRGGGRGTWRLNIFAIVEIKIKQIDDWSEENHENLKLFSLKVNDTKLLTINSIHLAHSQLHFRSIIYSRRRSASFHIETNWFSISSSQWQCGTQENRCRNCSQIFSIIDFLFVDWFLFFRQKVVVCWLRVSLARFESNKNVHKRSTRSSVRNSNSHFVYSTKIFHDSR